MEKSNILKLIAGRALQVVLFMLSVTACNKDLGNYNYHPINTPTIEGIRKIYEVGYGEILNIVPDITYSMGETKAFKYQWHVSQSVNTNHSNYLGVLGTEKELHATIGGIIPRAGSYEMMYCVTDTTTGVRTDYTFSINVQDRRVNGYIMLCETAKNFDIELISLYNGQLTQYHNMLDTYNSALPRTGKPIDMLCYGDGMSPALGSKGYKYALWILTDKSTDRVKIDNFEYQPHYNISSRCVVMKQEYRPRGSEVVAEHLYSMMGHGNIEGRDYLLFNGNYFFYTSYPFDVNYSLPINRSGIDQLPYKASPYLFMSKAGAMLFNEDVHRFELHSANERLIVGQSPVIDYTTTMLASETDYFDWNNPAYRMVYMGNRTDKIGFAIVKNVDTGKYELLQMAVQSIMAQQTQMTEATTLGRQELPNGVDWDNIRHYALHPILPYLFLATDEAVYRINISTANSIDDVTHQVIPSGHRISKLKFGATNLRFPRPGLMIVCTYNPLGTVGNNGQLTMYIVEDGTGDCIMAKHPAAPTTGSQIEMKWTGFGKIINVDYKNPAGN